MPCFEREACFSLYFVFDELFFFVSFPTPLCDFVDCTKSFWNTVLRHIVTQSGAFYSLSNNTYEQWRNNYTMEDSQQLICLIASAGISTHENTFLLQSGGVTWGPLGTRSRSHLAHKASDFLVSWLSDSDMLFDIFPRLLFHVHVRSILPHGDTRALKHVVGGKKLLKTRS